MLTLHYLTSLDQAITPPRLLSKTIFIHRQLRPSAYRNIPNKYLGDNIMSIHVIGSISNTVSKSLGVIDNTVDGISSAATIFKTSMQAAEHEALLETFIEQKKLLAASGLSEEEITEFKLLTA
jgi:hypothetical protein